MCVSFGPLAVEVSVELLMPLLIGWCGAAFVLDDDEFCCCLRKVVTPLFETKADFDEAAPSADEPLPPLLSGFKNDGIML